MQLHCNTVYKAPTFLLTKGNIQRA